MGNTVVQAATEKKQQALADYKRWFREQADRYFLVRFPNGKLIAFDKRYWPAGIPSVGGY